MILKNFTRTALFQSIVLSIIGLTAIQTAAQAENRLVIDQIDSRLFPQVEVYVAVSDPQGLPLKGLLRDDFTISEDGNPILDFDVTPIQNIQQQINFLLVIDTSGSMSWGEPPLPLDNAIEASKAFIDSLAEQDQVGIITFADKVSAIQELSGDKTSAKSGLDSLEAIGDTALNDAIWEAVQKLKDIPGRKAIILITDGVESGHSAHTYEEAISEAVGLSVPIYPIGFGEVHQDELERAAQLSGGYAQIHPDSSSLKESFATVLQILREQYLLRYISSLPADGAEHELVVSVDLPSTTLEQSRRFIAKPGEITIQIPDFEPGQTVGGQIRFAPEITSPAPISRMDINIDGTYLDSVLAEPFEYVWDSSSEAEGLHEFTFIVEDTAGNKNETTIELNISKPVIVSIETPLDGEEIGYEALISAQASTLSKIAKVEIYLDGDTLIHTFDSEPYEYSWNTQGVEFGEHVINITATDSTGNTGEEQVSVNVRHPVEVIIESPQAQDELRGSADIVIQASSIDDIAQVEILIDETIFTTLETPPYEVQWPLYNVSTGEHVLKVIATSVTGHTGEAEIPVIVGTSAASAATLDSGWLLWVAAAVVLILAAILVPLGIRRGRERRSLAARGFAKPSASLASPVLVELEGNNPGAIWELGENEVKLGRSRDENDIHLKGLKASRRHAIIKPYQGGHLIYNLKPNNPFYINDAPVNQQHVLKNGDIVRLGESVFRYDTKQ